MRLVGKRKRILSSSAAVSLLHQGRPTLPPALPEGDAGDDADVPCTPPAAAAVRVMSDCKGGVGGEVESSRRVKCPVCGSAILGSDYDVNSHLGTPVACRRHLHCFCT